MRLMIMSRVLLIAFMVFSNIAFSEEDHTFVIQVHVINKDDGRPLENKEILLFKWKSYFFGIASKKYLVDKAITGADGKVSFSVNERDSLELRMQRCPGDVSGMIHPFTDNDYLRNDEGIILSYSMSECIRVFDSSKQGRKPTS